MANAIERGERHYRRGLVMGLTMAEVMVLVLFALLLILGWFTRKTQTERTMAEALSNLFVELGGEPVQAAAPDAFDDNFRALSVFAKAGKSLREALGADDETGNPDATLRRATELMTLGKETESILGPNKLSQPPTDAAREFLKKADSRYRRGETGHGSAGIWFDSLIACSTKCGEGGGDPPPCLTGDDGRPLFIYDAHLRAESILLRDRNAPKFAALAPQLPDVNIAFDRDLSMGEFREQTSALSQWSRERRCRFYVMIVDETAATAKATYKIRLRTVGEHFFYYEPLTASGR